MSKILYICQREKNVTNLQEAEIKNICDSLNADNITPNPTSIHSSGKIVYGVSNPVTTFKKNQSSILLGNLFENSSWEVVGGDSPDGNYAIFRTDDRHLEVVSDTLGTRSIWYYVDNSIFVSSTSQRAIIQYLGSFEFDNRVIPWIISTGALGPEFSWDKRIKRIPTDGSLTLDKLNWEIEIKSRPVQFLCSKKSDKEYKIALKNKLEETFRSLDLNFSEWLVSLSGGYDSRAILTLLKLANKPLDQIKSVTWGDKTSLLKKDSDPSIAKEVASEYQVENTFYDTGGTNMKFKPIIDRFLKLGEGRNDKIPGYLDGFKTWKILFDAGHQGVIRGDEVFGYNKIYSSVSVRDFMGLTLCSDYPNLLKYEYIKSLEQNLPFEYFQKPGESLDTWRDRLFHLYRIPSIQASLADLKYPFIEQINPFLSKKIIYFVRTMPDHLRTNKRLFKKIISPITPTIPYAPSLPSGEKLKQLFNTKSTVEMIKKELMSENAKSIFPEEFLIELVNSYKTGSNKTSSETSRIKLFLKKIIPSNIKKRIVQKKISLKLDENKLRFRIYFICRMKRILVEDAKALKYKRSQI